MIHITSRRFYLKAQNGKEYEQNETVETTRSIIKELSN